jgi:hypothetical protein
VKIEAFTQSKKAARRRLGVNGSGGTWFSQRLASHPRLAQRTPNIAIGIGFSPYSIRN